MVEKGGKRWKRGGKIWAKKVEKGGIVVEKGGKRWNRGGIVVEKGGKRWTGSTFFHHDKKIDSTTVPNRFHLFPPCTFRGEKGGTRF